MACSSIRLDPGANWADDLPSDVLDEICSRLVLLPDYIRFGAVCKQWLSIALKQKEMRMKACHQQPPMLLILPMEGSQDHRNLYSVCEDKLYDFSLPIPHSKKCFGSPHGWWALAEKDLSMTLINPFSGKTINLPPVINECPEYPIIDDVGGYDEECPNFQMCPIPPDELIHKVILSCDPGLHPDDFVVAAIFGVPPTVVFIRSGDHFWSYPFNRFRLVNDIQFYRGRLYVLHGWNWGRLYVLHGWNWLVAVDCSRDYNDSSGIGEPYGDDEDEDEDEDEDSEEDEDGIECLVTRRPNDVYDYSTISYLVESLEGELLMIQRLYLWMDDVKLFNYYVTVNFKVYKLTTKHSSDQEDEIEWVEIQSLGNSSLFLGENHSTCISATHFPNCQPNCIYYSDDTRERDIDDYGAIDMGVFHLENGRIEQLYDHPQSLRDKPLAVWICPKLQ